MANQGGGHGVTGSRGHGVTGSRGHGVTGSRGHGVTGSQGHGVTGSQGHQPNHDCQIINLNIDISTGCRRNPCAYDRSKILNEPPFYCGSCADIFLDTSPRVFFCGIRISNYDLSLN